MNFRSIFLILASTTVVSLGCSSTTGFYTGDGGAIDARSDSPRPSGDGAFGKFDSGVKTDSGVRDTGTVTMDTKPPVMSCESCQTTYCSAEISACEAEQACLDTIACFNACASTDMDCPQRCVDTHASTRFIPFYNCIYDNCLDACSGG